MTPPKPAPPGSSNHRSGDTGGTCAGEQHWSLFSRASGKYQCPEHSPASLGGGFGCCSKSADICGSQSSQLLLPGGTESSFNTPLLSCSSPWFHPKDHPSRPAWPTHTVLQGPVLGVALAGPTQVTARTPVGKEVQVREGERRAEAGAAQPTSPTASPCTTPGCCRKGSEVIGAMHRRWEGMLSTV